VGWGRLKATHPGNAGVSSGRSAKHRLTAWRAPRLARKVGDNQPVHDLREIVNAILYLSRAGCVWEYLPHDFPPYKTVYGYFAAWREDGAAEQVHDLLRRVVRRSRGRAEEPTAVAIDSRS
jgi:transposase